MSNNFITAKITKLAIYNKINDLDNKYESWEYVLLITWNLVLKTGPFEHHYKI